MTFPQAVPYTTYTQSRILSVGSMCFKLSITIHYVLSDNLVLTQALDEFDFIACTLPTGLFSLRPMKWHVHLRKFGMLLVETLELPQFSCCWIFTCRVMEEWEKLFDFGLVLLCSWPKYNFYLKLWSRKVTNKTKSHQLIYSFGPDVQDDDT